MAFESAFAIEPPSLPDVPAFPVIDPKMRDLLVRTIIGEAMNEPEAGQAGVAHVALNRLQSGKWGSDIENVLMAPKQFEPWNTRKDELLGVSQSDPRYQRASAVADSVLGGATPDPTRGAMNFANPAVVEARGNNAGMSWINKVRENGTGVQIGNHLFGTPEGAPRGPAAPPQPFFRPQTQSASDWAAGLQARATGGAAARPDSFAKIDESFGKSVFSTLNAAPPEIRDQIRIQSGFRSKETQEALWQNALNKYGSAEEARKWVAPPGFSKHGDGIAIDFKFQSPEAKQWMHANASKFGLHFPLGHEPWHAEPIGSRDGTYARATGAPTSSVTASAFAPAQSAPARRSAAPAPSAAPSQGAEMNIADLPAAGATPTAGQSAFAVPKAGPDGESGGLDWDALMMGMALLANAVPNGQPAKDIGSIMSPFLQAQAKKDDRKYSRYRDERDFSLRKDEIGRSQSNADRAFQLQQEANRRADEASQRAESRPLIQQFKDDAGNTVYKQWNNSTRSWSDLQAPGGAAPAPAPAPVMPPVAGLDSGPAPAPSAPAMPPDVQGPPIPQEVFQQSQAPAQQAPADMVLTPRPAPPGVNREEWFRAETKRIAEAANGPKWDDVSSVRKEFQNLPSYKNVAQAAPVYRSMLDAVARDDRSSDVNLIYGMAKIMDPGSVVRESEMTVAQAIATLPEQLRQTIASQIQSTGRLSADVRDGIMREAYSRMNAYKGMYEQDAEQFRGIAGRRRMNPDDILPNFGEFKPWERPKGDTPAAAAAATTTPSVPAPTAKPEGSASKPADNAERRVINGRTAVKSGKSWFWED